ncbi:MAG: hypothetical protein K8I30_24200 [Anaerolineae bacterium]|nr:hypothetical protein [Anaerolineae bacterium]
MNTANLVIRGVVTLVIWACLTFMITLGAHEGNVIWLAIIMGTDATITTWRIWSESSKESAEELAAKSKRTSRVSRLVSHLDDDEIAELSDLLMAREESPLRDNQRRTQRLQE